jgi:hypothetical protein
MAPEEDTTMNDVVRVEAARPQIIAGHKPTPIVPRNLEEVWRIATAVCQAGLAPKGLEGPERVSVAIMTGLEVGMTPMAAIQRIAVVNGRAVIWGDGALGLVKASGLLLSIEEFTEKDVAYCIVHRRGEQKAVQRTFSVADAKTAGLWGKSGPWTNYPARMLQMRARAFALRDVFPDVLGGLYVGEEVVEGEEKVDNGPRRAPPPPDQIEAVAAKQDPEPAQRRAPDPEPTPEPARRRAPPPPPTEEVAQARRSIVDDYISELEAVRTWDDINEVEDRWRDALDNEPRAERDRADAVYDRVSKMLKGAP